MTKFLTSLTRPSRVMATAYAPKVVIFGDSITAQNEDFNSSSIFRLPRWFSYLQWLRGHPFVYNACLNAGGTGIVGHNAGIGGNTTLDMLARLGTDVLAKHPNIVFVHAGSNDITVLDATYAEITTRLQSIYTQILATGALVIALPILPKNATDGTDWASTAKRRRHLAVNEWIRGYCANTPGMVLCDWYGVAVNASGDMTTGYTQDGLHPGQRGSWYLANEVNRLIGGLFPKSRVGLMSPIGDYDVTDHLYGNLINGDFSGTGGTTVGTLVSGTLPDSIKLVNFSATVVTCAASIVSRSDGATGSAVRLTFTTTGSGGGTAEEFRLDLSNGTAITTNIMGNEWYDLAADMEFYASSAGNSPIKYPYLRLSQTSSKLTQVGGTPIGSDRWPDVNTGILSWRTPPMQSPNTNGMSPRLSFFIDNTVGAGTVTVDISRAVFRRMPVTPLFT